MWVAKYFANFRKALAITHCIMLYPNLLKKGFLVHYLLVADDSPLNLTSTRLLLEGNGYRVDTVDSGNKAVEMVRLYPNRYALVLLDYRMPDMTGADAAEKILEVSSSAYTLIYSGDPSREALKSAWKAGVVDFIERNDNLDDFLQTIANWCRKFDQTRRTLDSGSDKDEREILIASANMVGRSQALINVVQKIQSYRDNPQNCLILGETGTGKELVAQALHNPKRGKFYAINCAAYKGSTELLESELFGYQKGSFTGANQDKKGILESANGGTVFFDEVHQLSMTAQAKLLRVVQEKKVRRVGGTVEVPVDFRLIAAAKPDLNERTSDGDFLPDLYHRLNVLHIHVPPLRDRIEDIEPLITKFCKKQGELTGERKSFLIETVKRMENYSWPGNVRELEHTVYQLLADCPGDCVKPQQLDVKFFSKPDEPSSDLTLAKLKQKQMEEERKYLQLAIEKSKTKSEAARKLGVSPSTLHSLLQRAGITKQRTGAPQT